MAVEDEYGVRKKLKGIGWLGLVPRIYLDRKAGRQNTQ